MIYRPYKDTGIKTSLLGMGCMRLPTVGGPGDPVDYEKAQELIDYAYKNGVNYYDTAYIYHSGDSETFIGQALKKYPREMCIRDRLYRPHRNDSCKYHL